MEAATLLIQPSSGLSPLVRRAGFVTRRRRAQCYAGHDVEIPNLKGTSAGTVIRCGHGGPVGEVAPCSAELLVFYTRASAHFAIDLAPGEAATLASRIADLDAAIDWLAQGSADRW